MESLVSIKNLSKSFGSFVAVNDVSFSVGKGEVLGFLGPNGAGKTTTMRMITGYLPITSGSVSVCGFDISENKIQAQKKIGYLPEGGPLYNDMTPASFLEFIGEVRGLKGKELKNRIDFVVDKLSIDDVFYKTIDNLSKGYRRRVAMAQAILHDPQVLIMDEPTDGLDPNQKHEVRELISSMSRDKAIIISTHILEEVAAICSNAIIISEGNIVARGTPDELANQAEGHHAVVVRLRKVQPDTVINDILQIKNVERVNVEKDDSILVIPKKGKVILSDVGDVIRKKNLALEEIYEKTGQLDEAFRILTNPRKKKKPKS